MSTLSHTEMFRLLAPWHPRIFAAVKKDVRNEHLKLDKAFYKVHFGNKVLIRLTVDDLLSVYPAVIAKGHEKLAEFIANRWILRHIDVYNFFESKLKAINPQVEKIVLIDEEAATRIIDEAVRLFGAEDSYIFCIFNQVAFSTLQLERLRSGAEDESRTAEPVATI